MASKRGTKATITDFTRRRPGKRGFVAPDNAATPCDALAPEPDPEMGEHWHCTLGRGHIVHHVAHTQDADDGTPIMLATWPNSS